MEISRVCMGKNLDDDIKGKLRNKAQYSFNKLKERLENRNTEKLNNQNLNKVPT